MKAKDTGVTEGMRPRPCEPSFTTKEPGHGTGVAHTVGHGMVKAHGVLRTRSEAARGSTFDVFLPQATPRGLVLAGPVALPSPWQRARHVR